MPRYDALCGKSSLENSRIAQFQYPQAHLPRSRLGSSPSIGGGNRGPRCSCGLPRANNQTCRADGDLLSRTAFARMAFFHSKADSERLPGRLGRCALSYNAFEGRTFNSGLTASDALVFEAASADGHKKRVGCRAPAIRNRHIRKRCE